MEPRLGYKHRLLLEVITPVAIGNGETLSPMADYTVNPANKKEALLLSHHAFEKALLEHPDSMTDYIHQVNETVNDVKNDFLYQFISQSLNEPEPLRFFKERRMIHGNRNTVELKTCLKENGQPFIPGSTLKGAFKSAWLHGWLKEHPSEVDRIVSVIQSGREFRAIDREIGAVLSKFLGDIRKQRDERLHFSVLQISDAYMPNRLEWYHTMRFSLKRNRPGEVPQFIEAIAEGATGEFEIHLEENQVTSVHRYGLNELKSDVLTSFFEQINEYALDQIAYEIESVKNDRLGTYSLFLLNLSQQIAAANNQYACLPVGFGKSNFYQSIGWHIWHRDQAVFERYIELFRMGKKPIKGGSWQKELPLTRNLTIDSQLPLGWIRLTAIRKEREAKAVTQLEKGMQVEATVVKIGRPFSTVKLNGVTDSVKMSGTKEALRNPLFKEQAVVLVEIDLNKEGKVSQSRFIRVL